jgi:hypothetical protein
MISSLLGGQGGGESARISTERFVNQEASAGILPGGALTQPSIDRHDRGSRVGLRKIFKASNLLVIYKVRTEGVVIYQ